MSTNVDVFGNWAVTKKQQKRQEAEDRQAYRDSLTPRQQLLRIDRRLGVGVGAQKERAKLIGQMSAQEVEQYEREVETLWFD